ncbi:MAG: caspase family protein [Deltaproteobacteria bacterium]|nr:caspase family protein [Deltaproteobacteria bacterium]
MKRIVLIVSGMLWIFGCGGARNVYGSEDNPSLNASDNTATQKHRKDGDRWGVSGLSHIRLDLPWPDLTESWTPSGGGERDAAAVVAIERYDLIPGISGAKQNATAWYNFFTKMLKIPVGNVKLLPQRNATREGILSALEYVSGKAQPGGRVWFVFIGHGAPSNGDGLLLGVDVRQTAESLESRSLRRGDALAVLKRSQGQPVLVLDACFSGRTGGGDAVIEGLMPVRNADLPPVGRAIVMTAAAGDQYAGPLPGAAKPAFSYLALGALRGWGDKNGDGQITAKETVAYASDTIGALVNGREQTPNLHGGEPSYVLSIGNESGPDISKLARMLLEEEDVQFNPDVLVQGNLPTPNLPDLDRRAIYDDMDLDKLSIDEMKEREEAYLKLLAAKEKVEAARAATKNDPTGEKQQKAWCDLSELEDPNPYRKIAETACSQATSFVEQRRRLVIAMERNWTKVKYLIGLKSYSTEDKKRAIRSFLRSYGQLEEQGLVQTAATELKKIEDAEQKIDQGREIVAFGKKLSSRVNSMLSDERKEGDVLRNNCLNAKLKLINANIRNAEGRVKIMKNATDDESRNHEFTVLVIIKQKFRTLSQEANACMKIVAVYIQ